MSETAEKFDTWAVVELFGHQVIAGHVTEQSIGGQSFVRVDVPSEGDAAEFTKFYGSGAIYAMSPCSEELARAVVRQQRPKPIHLYVPELQAIPARTGHDEDDEDDFPL